MATFTEKLQNKTKIIEKKVPFSVRIKKTVKVELNDIFDVIEELQELHYVNDNALPHIPSVVEQGLKNELNILQEELKLFYSSLSEEKQLFLQKRMKNYSKLQFILRELDGGSTLK